MRFNDLVGDCSTAELREANCRPPGYPGGAEHFWGFALVYTEFEDCAGFECCFNLIEVKTLAIGYRHRCVDISCAKLRMVIRGLGRTSSRMMSCIGCGASVLRATMFMEVSPTNCALDVAMTSLKSMKKT